MARGRLLLRWTDQLLSLLCLLLLGVQASGLASGLRAPSSAEPSFPRGQSDEERARSLVPGAHPSGIELPFGGIVLHEWAAGIGLGSVVGPVARLYPNAQTAVQVAVSRVLSRSGGWSVSADSLVYAFEPLSGLPFPLDAYAGGGLALITWRDEGYWLNDAGRAERKQYRRWSANLRYFGGLSSYILEPLLEVFLDVGLDVDLVPLDTPSLWFSGGVLWRIPAKRD